MKRVVVFLIVLFFPLAARTAPAGDDLKEELRINLTLNADWDHKGSSGQSNKGSLQVNIRGTLRLNEDFTSSRQGLPAVLIAYRLQSGQASYTYCEEHFLNDPRHPPKCPNPQTRYDGQGSVSFDAGAAPMNLLIHYHRELAGNLAEMPMAPPPGLPDVLIDYYEFFLSVPEQEVKGTSQVYDAQTKSCRKIPQKKKVLGGAAELFFRLAEDGKMAGSRQWSADRAPFTGSSSVQAADLPEVFHRKPLAPEPKGSGDTRFSLTWDLDASPAAEIMRKKDGGWLPVSNTVQEVVAGEKIELAGRVNPESEDPRSGRWTVGESKGKPIVKYEASLDRAEVVHLDQGRLNRPDLVPFYWSGEGEEKVAYKTSAGGRDLTGEVTFKIRKPVFDFTAQAKQSNTYGPLQFGEELPSGECCTPPLSPQEQQALDNCKALKDEIDRLKKSTDPIDRGQKLPLAQDEYRRFCQVNGLQYDGVTFTACPGDDTPGKVQFVQLVSRTDTRQGRTGGDAKTETTPRGLDGCYPYPKNVSEYATSDQPGFSDPVDSVYLGKDFTFTMHLMFKPEGEGNEWVPLKLIDWHWRGGIRRIVGVCEEDEGARAFPPSAAGRDAGEYPTWNLCSQSGR